MPDLADFKVFLRHQGVNGRWTDRQLALALKSASKGYNPIRDLQKVGDWLAHCGMAMPGYGKIFIKEGGSGEVWYVGGDGDEDGFSDLVKEKLMEVEGMDEVTYEAESFPPKSEGWLQVYPKQREWKARNKQLDLSQFDLDEVLMGMESERDATPNEDARKQVVFDNLSEDPHYYSKSRESERVGEFPADVDPGFARPENRIKQLLRKSASDKLVDAINRIDTGHNFVHLGDLRRAAGMGKPAFDALIQQARREGKIVLSDAERWLSAQDEQEVIRDGSEVFLWASLRNKSAKHQEKGWITLRKPDQEEGTGTHVFVQDGKITAGPSALHGRAMDNLSGKKPANRLPAKPEPKPGEASDGKPKPGPNDGRAGVQGAGGEAAPAGKPLAGTPEATGDRPAGQGGDNSSKPVGEAAPASVPVAVEKVNKRLDKFAKHFRAKGQHEVADWMDKLRDHVGAVGTHEALASLGEAGGTGDIGDTLYEGGVEDMPKFCEEYLNRHGITMLSQVSRLALPHERLVSSISPKFGANDPYHSGDYLPKDPTFANKLEEAKHLPGLEASEDLGKILGKPVTHLTPEVTAKMDERYGKGQWIIKAYGDEAFAGFGIYFPQRVQQIQQDARNTLWASGQELSKYGFGHLRDESGKVVGIKHTGGDEYRFGTEKYADTIKGDARHWADKAAEATENEQGPALLDRDGKVSGKDFMAQPAFEAVGVSDADRASGKTIAPGEGRVHIVTRNGKAEIVPHSTWIKGEHLPVVFESDDTKGMAKAAVDAINALPESERQGQIYAPDIIKAKDGYRVVEANPANETGSSGYLGDNPFIIDSYVSHLVGREPAHVRFLRRLLSDNKKKEKGLRKFRTKGTRPKNRLLRLRRAKK